MFDCSEEITKFHDEKVSLPMSTRKEMRSRRDANRDRLKSGLNDEKLPNPTGMWSQGSYAMHTMIQAENNDYDIDDGIYFDQEELKDEWGIELGPYQIKDIVKNAVKHHALNPEIKNNCVRVPYSSGYHVDIPVYRTASNDDVEYHELASSTGWKKSDPLAVTKWFNENVIEKSPDETNGRQMRRMVRLLKDFVKCNSSSTEVGPSGFIITKLVDEEYEAHKDRDDKALYYTMRNIRDRLNDSLVVNHPIPEVGGTLTTSDYDPTTTMFRTKLTNAIDKLNILFETEEKSVALKAWGDVFQRETYFSSMSAAAPISENSKKSANDSSPFNIWVKSPEEVSPVDKKGGGRNA